MEYESIVSPTSQNFYIAWVKEVEGRREEVLNKWSQARSYTNMVISDEDSLLIGIAKKLGLKAYTSPYYAIDGLLYSPADHVNTIFAIGDASFFFHIRVAFEHENFFNSGIFQEVAHLLITNCDLRVLVTYPDRDNTQEEMKGLHELISRHPHNSIFSDKENLLMIFGYKDGPRWEGWVYRTTGWLKLIDPENSSKSYT